MIFNSKNRLRTIAFALGLSGTSLATLPHARAAVYFTPRAVLGEFFPHSERVTFQKFVLSAAQKERLARRLGYSPSRDSYVFYVATTGAHIDGYALIDDELGQSEPITFAVELSPAAKVERTEVLIYREPRGDEVRSTRFLEQLRGKTLSHALRVGVDVDAVSGATISSHALARGVRRALVLFDELVLLHPSTAAASR